MRGEKLMGHSLTKRDHKRGLVSILTGKVNVSPWESTEKRMYFQTHLN